jgi:localization factor PodJL
MSRAAAWSIRGIGRETREAAHEAARRAGISLSEWLDEAIAERAAEQGVSPDDFDADDRLDAIADRLDDLSRRDERPRRRRLEPELDEDEPPVRRFASREEIKRAEDLLEAAITRFEARAAKAEERTARALDSVADWMEKRRAAESEGAKDALKAMRQVETVARDLDKRIGDLSQRLDAAERNRREAPPAPPPRPRPRIDLADAVSQIARRRQALDAAEQPAAGSAAANGWRNFGVDIPAAPMSAAPMSAAPAATTAPPARKEADASELRVELQRLNQRLDELRRLQSERGSAPDADVAALRTELSAMSRALAELAPRNAIVAIEGAVRDLSDRVAALRDNNLRDSLAKPVDEIVGAIRETLQAHDPRKAVASLERDISAIRERLDAMARAKIEPEALERIRHQTEEVRAMLSAAALKPVPVDRLEKQIGELADKVDRLSSSRSPHVDSAQVVAALANAHAEIERSTPAVALNVIERRLEDVATRMDQALARSQSASTIGSKAVEELARRIDSVRETIETRHPLPIVSASLEATMRDLATRLQEAQQPRFNAEPFEAWMREMSAKLETARPVALDTKPLESWMRELTAKLEETRPASVDTRPLEGWMRELAAKLDAAQPASLDTRPFEQALRALDEKISQAAAPQFEPRLTDETAQALARQIEAKLKPAVDVGAIEAMIRSLEDKLQNAGGETSPEALIALHDQIGRIDARLNQTQNDLGMMVRALDERLRQAGGGAASPEALAPLRDQIGLMASRLDQTQNDLAALSSAGRLVGQLSSKLDDMREAFGRASMEMADRGDAAAAREIESLRAAQEASERRVQTTLGGVQGLLEKLVDRMTRIEDDSMRAPRAPIDPRPVVAPAPANNGAPPPVPPILAEKPESAPPKRGEPPPVAAPDRSARAGANMPRISDSPDFLIEPGAGAPAAAAPKAAINAHIAAARRAAQAAMNESAQAEKKAAAGGAPASGHPIAQARAFINSRRRPILLGLAFVILGAIAVIELGSMYVVHSQKSEMAPPPAKSANEAPAALEKNEARALDMAPTGSIEPPAAPALAHKPPQPAPADLVALIPPSAPQTLRDLAASGDPAAQYELANRLFEGRNVPRDMHAASQWFERAALQDFAPAQYRIGGCYEKGNGVERDLALAKAWYEKAALAGNIRAMHNLAVLLAEGQGAKPDYAEAAVWFRKAAQYGIKDSQFNLAILYARGMGVPLDLNQSWLWFSLAAQQGDADAAKKREEVAAKLDANALATDEATLAAFKPRQPDPAANEVKAPDGGWDGKAASASEAPSKPLAPAPDAVIKTPRRATAL